MSATLKMSTETPRAFAAAKLEAQAPQRADDAPAILGRTGGEYVHVLRRPREAEEDRAALPDEEVVDVGFGEGPRDLHGLERVEVPPRRHLRTTL
jgi:hypothetical protein